MCEKYQCVFFMYFWENIILRLIEKLFSHNPYKEVPTDGPLGPSVEDTEILNNMYF